jgi:hypothetical protein
MTNKMEEKLDRKLAELATKRALNAIKLLHSIVVSEDFENKVGSSVIKKGIGLSVGRLEMELLVPIFNIYPDLDDVKPAR